VHWQLKNSSVLYLLHWARVGCFTMQAENGLFFLTLFKERRVAEAYSFVQELRKAGIENGIEKYADSVKEIETAYENLQNAGRLLVIPHKGPAIWTDECCSVFQTPTDALAPAARGEANMIVDSILDANMPYVLVALREVHLYKRWLEGIVLDSCYTVPRAGKLGGGTCWVQFESPYPFLVENRDVCFEAEIFDCMGDITPHVMIVLKDHAKPVSSLGSGVSSVQMHIKRIVIRVLQLRKNATRITVHGSMASRSAFFSITRFANTDAVGVMLQDTKNKYLPSFFVNNLLAKTVCDIVARLGAKSKEIEASRKRFLQNPGKCSTDPHVCVMESDSDDFYLHFMQRMSTRNAFWD
jgi:hypothetical protein